MLVSGHSATVKSLESAYRRIVEYNTHSDQIFYDIHAFACLCMYYINLEFMHAIIKKHHLKLLDNVDMSRYKELCVYKSRTILEFLCAHQGAFSHTGNTKFLFTFCNISDN